MKELVKRLPKKEKPKKPKPKAGLTQKERFIAYAKEIAADESGKEFERAIDKIAQKSNDGIP